ncbi:MAG: PKD domain-containing protein [Candidatus Thiodiazotropha sp. (ex Lucina pensylvanica)]|nr:PKD domain-containing protein [Candidatus Thiodiazotropha sp. (ex Lucina pensylvanica)]
MAIKLVGCYIVKYLAFIISIAGLTACGGSSSGNQSDSTDTQAGNQAPIAFISADPTSGVVSLQVSVDGRESKDDTGIVGYQWDFGDGTASQLPNTSHIYTTAGSYVITLTVTDQEGETGSVSTTIHALATDDNSGAIVPTAVSFFDDFEYSIERNYSSDPGGESNPFTTQGGWNQVKAVNITGSHNGYLYTVDEIPGYSGSFPGIDSTRVLAIEARPGSLGSQTDFYLQFGDENAPQGSVPADVWFQFWIYPNNYDDPADINDQLSAYDGRFKFIYPCRGGYPCAQENLAWLYSLGHTTGEPYWANTDNRELYMTTTDLRYADYLIAPDYNQFKLGQTDVSENITPNRWTLVKIHMDTSSTSASYEGWVRPLGGSWVKVAEWIDGVTPDFSWRIPEGDVGGHRVFRIPTTMDDFDSWIYLDDFAMTASEADLPIYPN